MTSDPRANWRDRSSHHEGFVTIDGLRLHYLDWGGNGPPLLLLPGLGDTAHIFDELAPLLTNHYRVLALTRRGHGPSTAPQAGYSPVDLARDLEAFLNHLELADVTLVGHSVAGNEMTTLATSDARRLAKLVYLDAAYDRSGTLERMQADPASALPRPEKPRTLNQYREHAKTYFGFWNEALEADLRTRLQPGPNGELTGTPPHVLHGIVREANTFKPDYSTIPVPATAVYAMFTDKHWSPRASQLLEPTEIRRFMCYVIQPWQRRSIEQFLSEAPKAQAIELHGAHHHLFFSHRNTVVRLLIELSS